MWRLCGSEPARTYEGIYEPVSFGARSTAVKPLVLCVPSQNGLLSDPPHRHNTIFSSMTNGDPSASTSVTGPFTRYGPLSRTLIETSCITSKAFAAPVAHSGCIAFQREMTHESFRCGHARGLRGSMFCRITGAQCGAGRETDAYPDAGRDRLR